MTDRPAPVAADLFGDLLDTSPAKSPGWRAHLPGLAVTGIAALAAGYVAQNYGAPLMLMGLLFGLAFNFANSDERLQPGLAFASKSLLRWGIILLGFQITFAEIVSLGPGPFAAIACIVALVILSAVAAARTVRLSAPFGLLCGGAVAICGASAALAFASMLGEKRISQAQLTLCLVGIAAASAAAMSLYPGIATLLGYTDAQAGFVMGAAIHDVAQSLGAGYSISPGAGETATIVKLTRVGLLVPALAIASFIVAGERSAGGDGNRFPLFVLGFLAVAGVNSMIAMPEAWRAHAGQAAHAMLLAAVVATGIRSPMQLLLRQGWRVSIPVIFATLVAGAAAFGIAPLM
jgi:uncharacterized integral membrane protein (TIGR00698 family)